MKRLNGWQRIGVVLSVFWVISVGVWLLKERAYHADRSYTRAFGSCYEYPFTETVEDCLGKAREHRKVVFESTSNVMPADFAVFAFVPVALGWGLTWGGVKIARWVIAGFRL